MLGERRVGQREAMESPEIDAKNLPSKSQPRGNIQINKNGLN